MQSQPALNRYSSLKEEGVDTFEIIRLLREEFALSLKQAKEIMIQQETGLTLDEHQESLVEPLRAVLADPQLPTPTFDVGDNVETAGQGTSCRSGVIRDRVWDHKDQRWNYYIESGGKRISRSYLDGDLRLNEKA